VPAPAPDALSSCLPRLERQAYSLYPPVRDLVEGGRFDHAVDARLERNEMLIEPGEPIDAHELWTGQGEDARHQSGANDFRSDDSQESEDGMSVRDEVQGNQFHRH